MSGEQLEIKGLDDVPADLELGVNELKLLMELADTGRDLIRRTLMANQVPAAEVYNIKSLLVQADKVINKLESHLHDRPQQHSTQ